MARSVLITEVGLRDGLQNLKEIIPTKDKIYILNCLINAGLERIQVSSFVNQKLIPQMADAEKLISSYKNSVCFRLATVFGFSYRMRSDVMVNNFVYNAIKDKKLKLFEPKETPENFINQLL